MQKSPAPLYFKKLRFFKDETWEMLYLGVPTGLQSALYSFANTVITTTVNGFGPDATTGLSIANQFDSILYYITYSPALAVTPYVAQNLGAGKYDRVKKALVSSILITTCFGVVFGSLSAGFSGQLSSLMSSTPEVISYSQQKMIIISSTYFICGINEIFGGVMRGLRKPLLPTICTLLYMCLLRFVWIYLVFPLCPTLSFLYTVWPVGWVLSILTLVIPCLTTIRKLQKQKV
jgi:Na+-driven multidrug efflux pump